MPIIDQTAVIFHMPWIYLKISSISYHRPNNYQLTNHTESGQTKDRSMSVFLINFKMSVYQAIDIRSGN